MNESGSLPAEPVEGSNDPPAIDSSPAPGDEAPPAPGDEAPPAPGDEAPRVPAGDPLLDPSDDGPPDPAPGPPGPGERALAVVERLAIGRTPDVRPGDAWAEAGRKVLRFHLARMLARVPGVLAGDDPEDVHAMRVAARRMRAAWRVFGDGFEPKVGRRYRRDLRAFGQRLGAVRDLDVLIEILVGYGAHRSARERSRLRPLLDAWGAERAARLAALAAWLDSGEFTAFVAEYEALVMIEGMDARPVVPHSPDLVRHRIAPVVWTSYGDAWAYEDHIAAADMATLHELRIAGKWLRYALEFVREPLEPEATVLIGRTVALQDHLGVLHDMHVAAGLADAFVAATPGLASAEREAIGRFGRQLERNAARLQQTVGTSWKPLVAAGYRRALGRALARL